jgi:hypothetical protein
MNLDMALKELYREYLIAGSSPRITCSRARAQLQPGRHRPEAVNAQLATPLMGVIPAETSASSRTTCSAQGELAYLPSDPALKDWLDEFLGEPHHAGAQGRDGAREPRPRRAVHRADRGAVERHDMFTPGRRSTG